MPCASSPPLPLPFVPTQTQSLAAKGAGIPAYCLELHRASWRLAQQQRSSFYAITAAVGIVLEAADQLRSGSSSSEGGSGLQALRVEALEAWQQAEAALAGCKRLLPEQWVLLLKLLVEGARPAAERLHAALGGQQQQSQSQPVSSKVEELLLQAAACASCRKMAVGLRRCSRCVCVCALAGVCAAPGVCVCAGPGVCGFMPTAVSVYIHHSRLTRKRVAGCASNRWHPSHRCSCSAARHDCPTAMSTTLVTSNPNGWGVLLGPAGVLLWHAQAD